ncbi:MAG TPA: hypothetical protein VIK84_01620 [Haloplasmataceae bacterium]
MTNTEMILEFKLTLDKVDSSSYPDFADEEIYFFLNESQDRIIKTRYSRNNLYKSGFEEIQKRIDDLSNIVVTNYAAVTSVSTETNTYKIDISTLYTDEAHTTPSTESYMFYLRSRPRVVKTGCTSKYINKVKLVQHDDLAYILEDPFNKPILLEPVIYFERGDIYLVTDGTFTIDKCKLTYIKRPAKIDEDTDCELAEYLHKEIVQMAVNIALESIESPRQQTQGNQLNTIE